RRMEGEPLAAGAGWAHVDELSPALRQLLDHDPRVVLVDVDDHLLDRLAQATRLRVLPHHDARPADRHLEAFATHRLDQHRQLQLAATGDPHRVGVGGVADPQRPVALRLAVEPHAAYTALDPGYLECF